MENSYAHAHRTRTREHDKLAQTHSLPKNFACPQSPPSVVLSFRTAATSTTATNITIAIAHRHNIMAVPTTT